MHAAGLVLIANDHEWTARSVETILIAAGHEVVRAHTGREALELAARRRPDVFILDQQLPDISGLQVCEAIRSDPAFGASTPVIITTAGPSGRVQRLAAYSAGAWEFYGQPLDGEALLHRVRVFLAARQEAVGHALAGLLDHETGLYNPRGLERRQAEFRAEQRRLMRPLCRISVAVEPGAPHGARRAVQEVVAAVPRLADVKGRADIHSFAVLAATDQDGADRLVARLHAALAVAGVGGGEVRVAVEEVTLPDAPPAATP